MIRNDKKDEWTAKGGTLSDKTACDEYCEALGSGLQFSNFGLGRLDGNGLSGRTVSPMGGVFQKVFSLFSPICFRGVSAGSAAGSASRFVSLSQRGSFSRRLRVFWRFSSHESPRSSSSISGFPKCLLTLVFPKSRLLPVILFMGVSINMLHLK